LIKNVYLRSLLLAIIMMIIASVSYADEIHLKNRRVITGEIISFDDTFVITRESVSGLMRTSKGMSINSTALLLEKRFKKERIEAKLQKQIQQYTVDFIEEEKKLISIHLGGGLNNINGGDLNSMITDYKQWIEDYNEYYITDYSVNWKELKWIQNFRGEVLLNLSSSFSIGLGTEYLTKKSRGTNTFNNVFNGTIYESTYYYDYSLIYNYTGEPEYRLTAIPVTLNAYFFMPINNRLKVFIVGGIGYYFGQLKYNNPYQSDSEYNEDHYANDGTYLYSWLDDYSYDGTETYQAKCNKIGLHGGVGVDFKLFSNISLVAEANYRHVSFKDWKGSWSDNWSWNEEWGWSDLTLNEDSGSVNESISNGKIWAYEYEDSDMGKQYLRLLFNEGEPTPQPGMLNIRQAKINLNGFSLRLGVKISF